MWNFVPRNISTRLKGLYSYSRWNNRFKKHFEYSFGKFSKRDIGCNKLFRRLRGTFDRHGKKAIVFSGTSIYNASKDDKDESFKVEDHKIDDHVLENLSSEINEIDYLKKVTIFCQCCKKRLLIDKIIQGIEYCRCTENKAVTDHTTGWEPFLESEDTIIWRKKYGEGLYAYKVYGCYNEVSAEDFLALHIDTEYWKTWDSSAVSVRMLEGKNNTFGGQCVIHWEMMWPKFFANRDYVYTRKYAYIDSNTGKSIDKSMHNINNNHSSKINSSYKNSTPRSIIVLSSRSCEHPDAPITSTAHRIKEYWSNLVIKPLSEDCQKPGMEFSLTYFEDPGTSIPLALQSWIAGCGMPDFLARKRKAAALYKEAKNITSSINIKETIINTINDHVNKEESNFVNHTNINESGEMPKDENYKNIEEIFDLLNVKNKLKEDGKNVIFQNDVKKYKSDIDLTLNDSDTESNLVNSKDEPESIPTDNPDKTTNQNSSNNYSYWHLWPLNYFA